MRSHSGRLPYSGGEQTTDKITPPEPMKKQYFLFGEQAVSLYHVSEFNTIDLELRGMVERTEAKVAAFDNPCDPVTVLYSFDGWDGYAVISKSEYEFLKQD